MQNDLNLTKATMVLVNTMGWPIVRHVHVQRSVAEDSRTVGELSGAVSDDVSLVLQYIPKGKRKPTATRLSKKAGSQIAIYIGWHNVETPAEFTIFEDGLLAGMKSQIDGEPVFEIA